MSVSPLLDLPLGVVATALHLYPIKSCAGIAVDAIELDARGGAAGDRGWAIVDAEGIVTWQGSHPRLALVAPRFVAPGPEPEPEAGRAPTPRLALSAPGMATLHTPPNAALHPREVKIFNEQAGVHEIFEAADAGDDVASWLAAVTGAPLRLVRLGEAALARDGTNALHLVFRASIEAVDGRLAADGRPPADPRRYRPNIVLSSADAALDAFLEDSVESLDWRHGGGTSRLAVTSLCVRCIVPNVDPVTAAVSEATGDALAALSQRRRPGEPTAFGIYARGEPGMRIALGDTATLDLAF